MTTFTAAPSISIELDGKSYSGSYVIDGQKLVVYVDGYGQQTAGRSATPDPLMAKLVMRSIVERASKRSPT